MDCGLEIEQYGAEQRTVVRFGHGEDNVSDHASTGLAEDGGRGRTTLDVVAEEMPVALVFNGISHAVMMATPVSLTEFAAGFALTEGIVPAVKEIYGIETRQHAKGVEVQLTISQQSFHALKARRRSLAGRSGCGVCGIESLVLLDLQPERVAPLPPMDMMAAVQRSGRALPEFQQLMRQTGGVHAAAWCGFDGAVRTVYEDVGRHNALDKLIGRLALDGGNHAMRDGFVFMSSRASYELVRKAARMGIPMLAAISAPSTLAIDLAHQAGMALLGFCRQGGCVQYSPGQVDARSNTGIDFDVGVPAPSATLFSGTSGLVSG